MQMNVQHRGAPRPPQLCHVSSSPSAPSSSCYVTLCSRVKCAPPRHPTCVWLFPPATYNDSSPKKHPTLCFHIKKAPHKSAGASSNRHGTRNQSRRSRSPSHTEGAYRFHISKPQKFPRREAAPFPPPMHHLHESPPPAQSRPPKPRSARVHAVRADSTRLLRHVGMLAVLLFERRLDFDIPEWK